MTAAAANKDRQIEKAALMRLPLKAAQLPFVGSAISSETTGFMKTLATKEPFKGFARMQVLAADTPAADGGSNLEMDVGIFLAVLPVTGVAQDDIRHRRKVYASDDNTFAMLGSGSLIGEVVGIFATDTAIVLCRSAEYRQDGPYGGGFETLADADATLTTAQLDKVLIITPTAGRTITLPVAADCTGRTFCFKNLAAQVLTIDGDAAETVDGATTSVLMDAANDTLTFVSDGTKWLSIAGKIA